MIEHLISQAIPLVTNLAQNQFASGGLFLMIMALIGTFLKGIPAYLYETFLYFFTTTLSFDSDSPFFEEYAFWIHAKQPLKKSRRMYITRSGDFSHEDFTHEAKKELQESYQLSGSYKSVSTIPDAGRHFFFYKWRFAWLSYSRQQSQAGGGYNSKQLVHYVTLRFFTRNRKLVQQFIADLASLRNKSIQNYINIYSNMDGEWSWLAKRYPRSLDSVILPKADQNRLQADLDHFANNKQWYIDKGLPYRRGYLLYGPPGTGKTSLAMALGSHLNCRVYLMSVSSCRDDQELWKSVSAVRENSIILIEDVDSLVQGTSRKKTGGGITLAGLLNVLDGAASKNGCIYILSTNHPEKLDPALLRPGRMDLQLHLTYAIEEQVHELHERLIGGTAPDWLVDYIKTTDVTMGELQEGFVRHLFCGLPLSQAINNVRAEILERQNSANRRSRRNRKSSTSDQSDSNKSSKNISFTALERVLRG